MRKVLIFMREFALMTAKIIEVDGRVSTRHRRRLREWTLAHRDGLMENWQAVRAGKSPRRLD
jgi:hypothetical protein